jgi:hypothetical protein
MKCNYMLMIGIISFSFLTATTSAQMRSGGSGSYDQKNIIKLNFSPLLYRTVSLQYERILGERNTVNVGVNYMPNGAIPFSKPLNNTLDNSDDILFSETKISNLAITPEFRYYFDEASKGFYIAPYLRYRNLGMKLPVKYQDNSNVTQKVGLNGNLSSFMIGLMIGSQFDLSDRMTIDWFIIGGHIRSDRVKLAYSTTAPLSTIDQQDLKKSFEDIKKSATRYNNLEYTVSANSGSVKVNTLGFGFRGGGLSLGYRF